MGAAMGTALKLLLDPADHAGNFRRHGLLQEYAIAITTAPAIVKASRLDLSPKLNVAQGLRAVVINCLEQIQGNEAGVIHGNDPESVHQMRIGLHRLLCAVGIFSRVAPCPRMLHDELKWLGTELGAVRDWDVLANDTLPEIIAAHPDQAELLPLQKACMQRARKKHRHAAAAIDSARYAHLILSCGSWADSWAHGADRPLKKNLTQPLAKFAKKILARRHKKLQEKIRLLHDAETSDAQANDAPQLQHKIRIAAKKNRYAIEFFKSLFPAKSIQPYLKTLTALQTVAGRMNDAVVAMRLLHSLGQERADLALAAGFCKGYLAIHRQSDTAKLDKACKRLAR
jgi:triphosphatase